jgi:hypothetical protein
MNRANSQGVQRYPSLKAKPVDTDSTTQSQKNQERENGGMAISLGYRPDYSSIIGKLQ